MKQDDNVFSIMTAYIEAVIKFEMEKHKLNEHGINLFESIGKWAQVADNYKESLRVILTEIDIADNNVEGVWPADCIQRAFVDGAKWWQFHKNGSTMFSGEREEAEQEAIRRYGEPKILKE